MNLVDYFVRNVFLETPKRYFLFLSRFWLSLSHKFGIMVMLRSMFKPLFGEPGLMSRINGVAIRTLVLLVCGPFMVFTFAVFACAYFALFLGPFYLLYHGYFLETLLLFIGLLGIIFFNFIFKPISHIVDVKNYEEYFDAGDYKVREHFNHINYNNFEKLIVELTKSVPVKEFILRLELDYMALTSFLHGHGEFKRENFLRSLVTINTDLQRKYVDEVLFFSTLLCYDKKTDDFLARNNLDRRAVVDTAAFFYTLKDKMPQMWDDDYILPPAGGVDKGWAISYTPQLNQYGNDLTKAALKGYSQKLVGRSDIRDQVIKILSRKGRNNVLLIGNSGTGKTTFIKGLAREIALGTTISALKYKRIVSLDLTRLISGGVSESAKRIDSIIKEIDYSGDVILFIDDIHNLFLLDKSSDIILNELQGVMSSSNFQFIGTTSRKHYDKFIVPNGSFANVFENVEMRETTKPETLRIMFENSKQLERDGVIVTFPAIAACYDFSQKYINDRYFPDKATQILMSSSTEALSLRRNILDKSTVLEVMSRTLKIPISNLDADEKNILLTLQADLSKKIIGQTYSIKMISDALKRDRVGVRDENKPIASFLFAGPTGVGKTETAKVLAQKYFGDENFMIRIDMSEYQTRDSVEKFIGSAKNPNGYLVAKVKERPFSLILLDEIEKADKNILNLFLQVLDDGRLSDGDGNLVSFKNTFIIMTTNVGTRESSSAIEKSVPIEEVNATLLAALKTYFSPEFLNRFTALVPYSPLSRDDIFEVAELKIDKLKINLEKQKYYVDFSEDVIKSIGKEGYSPEWGARYLNRAIEQKLETRIADLILNGDIKKGEVYKFDSL
jgi:ATP-dependent Clp protease ATP-binding subunit ClpC